MVIEMFVLRHHMVADALRSYDADRKSTAECSGVSMGASNLELHSIVPYLRSYD